MQQIQSIENATILTTVSFATNPAVFMNINIAKTFPDGNYIWIRFF